MITTEFSFCHITIKLRVGNAPELVQPASGDAAELQGRFLFPCRRVLKDFSMSRQGLATVAKSYEANASVRS